MDLDFYKNYAFLITEIVTGIATLLIILTIIRIYLINIKKIGLWVWIKLPRELQIQIEIMSIKTKSKIRRKDVSEILINRLINEHSVIRLEMDYLYAEHIVKLFKNYDTNCIVMWERLGQMNKNLIVRLIKEKIFLKEIGTRICCSSNPPGNYERRVETILVYDKEFELAKEVAKVLKIEFQEGCGLCPVNSPICFVVPMLTEEVINNIKKASSDDIWIFTILEIPTKEEVKEIFNGKHIKYEPLIPKNVIESAIKKDIRNKKEYLKFEHLMIQKNNLQKKDARKCLFNWDEIPGDDNSKLIEFLIQNFGVNWAIKGKINKINEGKTIQVSFKNNSLSLRLNNERTLAIMEIDDGRASGFIAMMENGKLNIYQKNFINTINYLAESIKPIIKRGYFFLSNGSYSDWWVDLVKLDQILENEYKFMDFKHVIESLLIYFTDSEQLNTIILPRWTTTTEDWFIGTLYRLRIEESKKNFGFQEIIKLGEAGFYVRSVSPINDKTDSLSIIGLSIHDYVIKELEIFLNKKLGDIKLKHIISVIHRNGSAITMKDKIFPLFLANKNGITPFTETDYYLNMIELEKLESTYKKIIDESIAKLLLTESKN